MRAPRDWGSRSFYVIPLLIMESKDASAGFRRLVDHYAAQLRWPEVKRYATEQLKLDPTDTVAHYWAGWASLQMDDLKCAEQHARSLGSESPDIWPTHILWCELFLARNEVINAAAASVRAVECAPEVACCHHALSRVYLRRGEYPQAKRAIEEALRLDPDNALYRMFLTIVSRLDAAAWTPQSAVQEIATLKRVLALEPRNSWVLARIGKVYATELFDYEQAIDYLQQSLEIDVTNEDARAALYEARLRQSRLYRAMIAPLSQLNLLDTDGPHWKVPWIVLPVVFYAVLLVSVGAVYNLIWLWLPAKLYRHLVLTEICRTQATYAWQSALYRRLVAIPLWLRGFAWLLLSLLYGSALFLWAAIYAPWFFVPAIAGCLSFVVAWRMRREGRRAATKATMRIG